MNYDLYHYYDKKHPPFRNLSSLSMDAAHDVLQQLQKEGKGFASQRSDDYLVIRKELEQRARLLFISKGGKPNSTFPHYMTLGECSWLKSWYRQGEVLKINMNEFNEKHISFTYGDLFPTMRFKDGKSYREQVYTRDEIIRVINKYGLPQDWNKSGDFGPERYIEVQIWDEEVIRNYINN